MVYYVERVHFSGLLSNPMHSACLDNILCVLVKRSSSANRFFAKLLLVLTS